ncbi:MAG TPA: helix-turn-helix domain-containing protein, partial [Polyangiaceae bacterium]|nr:helix-turn-helix domain-containing protein [Polyangiaceae bacterium]
MKPGDHSVTADMNEKTSKSAVPALDRGLDVLEAMAGSSGARTLTEIARVLGRTVSEVQRTVAQLALRGYLVRDDRGTYRLSSKLFRMATAFPPFRDLVSRASTPMQQFADSTNESVHLCVLSDDQ